MSIFQKWLFILAGSTLRYLLFVVSAYLFFYVWKRNRYSHWRIQPRFPQARAIRTELRYSLYTLVIFSIIICCTIVAARQGHTRMYFHLRDHSLFYFPGSILLIILLHDTYFYWTHRLMHWKKIFRYIHRVHHLSHNPTPLAAFSFHPLEAVIEAGIVPLVAWIIPAHPLALAISGLYMILMNVMGHLGYELFPKSFIRNKWLNWQNTSTHHNMHHHYTKHNYGLYFNWWDRLMGTNHPRYREEFRAHERKPLSFTEESRLFAEKKD